MRPRTKLHPVARLGQLCLLGAVLSPFGCAKKEPSAIVIAVTTDYSTPSPSVNESVAELTSIDVQIDRNNNTGTAIGDLATQILQDQRNPATLTIQADPDLDTSLDSETVITLNMAGSGRKIQRTARVTFLEGKTKLLRMHIGAACERGDLLGCASTQTCVGNQCVDNKVDVNTLEDYSSGLVFPEGDNCFNNTLSGCFSTANTIDKNSLKALLSNEKQDLKTGESDCYAPLGKYADGNADDLDKHLNIALIWDSIKPRFSVLNKEPSAVVREGWALDRSSSPARLKLPRGLCRAIGNDQVAGMVIALNNACKPKDEKTPLCKDPSFDSDSSKIAPLDFCTAPIPLDAVGANCTCPKATQPLFNAAKQTCIDTPGCAYTFVCSTSCTGPTAEACRQECQSKCSDEAVKKAKPLLESLSICCK